MILTSVQTRCPPSNKRLLVLEATLVGLSPAQLGYSNFSGLFPLAKRVLKVIGGTDLMYVFCSVALYSGVFNSNTFVIL